MADRSWDGLPDGVEFGDDGALSPPALWLDEATGRFAVVTGGSGSCPTEIRALIVDGPSAVTVQARSTGGPICTADMVFRTHELTLPSDVSERPVSVTVEVNDWATTVVLGD